MGRAATRRSFSHRSSLGSPPPRRDKETSPAAAMCPTKLKPTLKTPSDSDDEPSYDWRQEVIDGGSLRRVDLHEGSNGWASPPGDLFFLRGPDYFSRRKKIPSGNWLLLPAGVDWLRSPHRLDNVLGRPDNRVAAALRRAHSFGKFLKSFVFAVNLQVPGHDCHSAVFYFATDDPIPPGSLLHRFIHGDDAFRNSRFKMVNRIVKGPWLVKAAVGNYSACLLGKALPCNYYKGDNYLEVDVDIGSSAIASAILKLALGYVTSVTIDMGFVVEAQAEEELPEKLIGAVRIAQMEMSAAAYVEPTKGRVGAVSTALEQRRGGPVRIGQERDDEAEVISSSPSETSFAELNAKTPMNASSAFFISSVLVLLLVIVIFVVLWRHRKRTLMNIWRSNKFSTNGLPEQISSNLRTIFYFDYHTLKRATENFNPRNQLGKGGFGPVYQGRLDDGRRIAVKQLCLGKSGQGESEFLAEVRMLTSIQHKNLVRLIGCCSEGSHRLVVYEFMKNRSLDRLIYGNSEIFLNWKSRFQIILGIARGLQYLHEDSNLRIVHRDIKASNILLNEKFQPKISDFGLARLFPEDESYLSTQFAGTLGYTAPEYAIKGELSEKADIYSFGVLTLEIICSRRNTDLTLPAKMQYLPEYAWKLYESSILLDLVDPRLKADGIERDDVLHVCQVALLCLQPFPSLRPSMSEVVAMLTSKTKLIPSPVKPAFLDRKRGIDMDITPSFSCEIVSEFFPSPASDSITPPPRLAGKSSLS